MRFYTERHDHYCGIDLHAKTMYVCILDSDGTVRLHRNMPCTPEALLAAIAPYRANLVVAVECVYTWYWVADLCAREGIPFVLGHALYMKAVHGAKAKNDRIDAHKIAALLLGKLLPQSYVYPARMRATRDLLRRRLHFTRLRGELFAHIQMTYQQHHRPAPGTKIHYPANRAGLADGFSDSSTTRSLQADLALLERYDEVIAGIELSAVRQARGHDPQSFARLKTIPGVGKILGLTLLYEVHDIDRFPTVQDFASYCRLVKCQRSSAGKVLGSGGSKIGNVHLKWAFSEAVICFLHASPEARVLKARLEKKHGKGRALSLLAHRLGRTTWYMLRRKKAFDQSRFFATGGVQ
jgi:transposase